MRNALWSVFWRTFAALALPVLAAVQVLDWTTEENWKSNAIVFGLGLLGAAVGAGVAVLMASSLGFAETPLGKALRALTQSIAQVLTGLAFNTVADLTSNAKILVAGIPIVVFAFLVAFFQNQGSVPNVGSDGQDQRSAVADAFTRNTRTA